MYKCISRCFNKKEDNEKILNKLDKIEKKKYGKYSEYFYKNKEIKKFELNNIELYVKVIDIYEKEIIKGIIFLYNEPNIIEIKLSDLDIQEVENNNIQIDIKERALCIICKIILEEYINNNNNIIYLKTFGNDKYGRTLGRIYKSKEKGICFNDILLNCKVCDKYYIDNQNKELKKMYYDYDTSLEIIKIYENNEKKKLLNYLEKKIDINLEKKISINNYLE